MIIRGLFCGNIPAWPLIIKKLQAKHTRGGNTDESRLGACIAKVVADVLQRELMNFQWNIEETQEADPASVFRETVKAFVQVEKDKWKK